MRSISGWTLVGLGAVAFGSANAQVDQRRFPETRTAQYQPAPQAPGLQRVQPVVYPTQTYAAPTGFEAYKPWLAARARREGVR